MLHAKGKQLRSCWVGQLLNHTVPGASLPEVVYHYKVSIMSSITENYRFYSRENLRYITYACYRNVNGERGGLVVNASDSGSRGRGFEAHSGQTVLCP